MNSVPCIFDRIFCKSLSCTAPAGLAVSEGVAVAAGVGLAAGGTLAAAGTGVAEAVAGAADLELKLSFSS